MGITLVVVLTSLSTLEAKRRDKVTKAFSIRIQNEFISLLRENKARIVVELKDPKAVVILN